ncbi:MAG: hypothetical protein WAM67_17520 [Candidatus Acidiferrales bacterium]
MRSPACWKLPVLLLATAFIVLQPALASYVYPLSSEAIREAYFLGKRNDEQTAAFFTKYVHALPPPKSGPYVAAIGVDTPYSSIVRRVQSASDEYHAQEAEQEFLGKPGTFGVWVQIDFTPSFPDPSQFSSHGTNAIVMPAFWQDFKIRLEQDRKIEPESVIGGPSYSDVGPLDQYGFSGAEIDLDYDPSKIDASTPATVDVVTPDGQDVQTTFDLAELR